jgi:hypothetical protein
MVASRPLPAVAVFVFQENETVPRLELAEMLGGFSGPWALAVDSVVDGPSPARFTARTDSR